MLLLSNDDVRQVLTMADTIDLLDRSYRDLAGGEAVCRPRIDIRIPTGTQGRAFQWGTMEGGAAGGYFAIRMKADIVTEQEYGGTRTQEKYCVTPGRWCGLVLLLRTANAEPLALIQDGWLQHFRVAGDGAIGARHLARPDASTLGLLGSGGMARTHVEALLCVRPLRRVRVYSPTPANREAFAAEVRARGLEVEVCDEPQAVYRGADILAALTDATQPVTDGRWLEPGTHVLSIGAPLDPATVDRLDISLRLGTSPAPAGLPAWGVPDEVVAYYARSGQGWWRSHHHMMDKVDSHAHRLVAPDRLVALEDLLARRHPGRTSPTQITYSERGNVQGAQFFPVAGRIYELASAHGLGREIPTDWLLQDIRD